jgi:hypothetical protein
VVVPDSQRGIGLLVPGIDRNVGVSSRNYRFSANAQVLVDANTG